MFAFFRRTPLGFKALPFSQYLLSHVQTHNLIVMHTEIHTHTPYLFSAISLSHTWCHSLIEMPHD